MELTARLPEQHENAPLSKDKCIMQVGNRKKENGNLQGRLMKLTALVDIVYYKNILCVVKGELDYKGHYKAGF